MIATYLWKIFINLIRNTIVACLLFHRLALQNPKYYIGTFISFVLLFCVLLSMLVLIKIISKTFQENKKLIEQIHMHEKKEELNKAVFQSAMSLQKWKHDYNNHLAVMHELIETKSYDELRQYVRQQREYLPKTYPIINTGHRVIDAILTDKYAVTQAEHISFVYSVILPKHFPVDDIEITGILGNLLDNSIEACKDIKQKRGTSPPHIRLSIKPQRSMFHIYVENSSSGNYLYNSNGQLESTKKETGHHGHGLSNVIEIAETHSGFCNITAESDCFAVDVYIPLSIER